MSVVLDPVEHKARLGDTVYWYPGGDTNQQPLVAIVLSEGTTTLCLGIFQATSYNLAIRDGVRHVSDKPPRHAEQALEAGCWDYTPQAEEHEELKAKVDALWAELKGDNRPMDEGEAAGL